MANILLVPKGEAKSNWRKFSAKTVTALSSAFSFNSFLNSVPKEG